MESLDSDLGHDPAHQQLWPHGNGSHSYSSRKPAYIIRSDWKLTHPQGPYSRGVEWPMMLMAISASVIQVVGLIPPYFELAKRSGRVIGIGWCS